METSMTRAQIGEALAAKYREEYARYAVTERLAREALDEGDQEGHSAISRRAQSKSQILYGLRMAAEALGIGCAEFDAAINADKARR